MTRTDLLQLVGTVSIAMLAVILWVIGRHYLVYGRYGQEALLCTSAFLACTVVTRMLALFHVMSQANARVASGLLAAAAVVVILQIVAVHHREQKLSRGREGGAA